MENSRKGFSLTELIIVLAVIGMIAVATIPKSLASPGITNERFAIASIRAIVTAQGIYRATIGAGNAAQSGAVLANAGLIDSQLGCAAGDCVKDGYVFTTNVTSDFLNFNVVAVPVFGSSGSRSFYANEAGVIYYGFSSFSPVADSATREVSGGIPFYNMFPNKFDFYRDGRSDVTTYRPADGIWYMQLNFFGVSARLQFGLAGDKIVPADYDLDGRTNFAVYRNGTWFIYGCSCNLNSVQFGEPSDIPVPADYDGDGRADLAVFRPSSGTWYLRQSNDEFAAIPFGQSGDKPVAGDFDGDGKADLAVFRPSEGIWYIQQSNLGLKTVQFGVADDKLVAADYDGDGKMDIAVFRPSNGTWYLDQSRAGIKGFQFGISTDVPIPADYDGDGKTDISVFRNGTWHIQQSGINQLRSLQFGASDHQPVASAFVR
ncbi:MAG: FG-GAP-like repeat-containing protein [Pyrinomonadaceae bacterium]|nr:FG-GAP-like repeat-containing protein [Pyrinomonadaceae bacterium]